MAMSLEELAGNLQSAFAGKVVSLDARLGELTMVVKAADMTAVFTRLRDDASLHFEQLIDLCGMDYSAWGSDINEDGAYLPAEDGVNPYPYRFAVIYHFLSVKNNVRLRVRIFAEDEAMPLLESVTDIWPCANWFEREAFDMYGIVFTGHPDLRRILTDYGFVGNPFRKDFPLSGTIEMRYDPAQQRVIYEPVNIEPREVTPRTLREETYGHH